MKKIRSITFIAEKFHDKTYGNTYHAGVALVNGIPVACAPYQYGYGSQYEESLFEALEKAGVIKDREHYKNGGSETMWRYCDRKGIAYYAHVNDNGQRAIKWKYGTYDKEGVLACAKKKKKEA